MPRPKSVILTPAEKKEALAAARADLKEAKIEVRKIVTFIREKEKLHAQNLREQNRNLREANKLVEAVTKRIATLTA